MDSYVPDLETTRVKVSLAFEAYKADKVRLAQNSLHGFTHLLASRQGLYAINETQCVLIAHGFFFGITFRANDIFVFECCDLPRSSLRHGRLIKLTVQGTSITGAKVVANGLDNGCHQIDFIDGRMHVLDTYNQKVLRFAPGESEWETLQPLPPMPAAGWKLGDPNYAHANSLLAVGDRILLLLHNAAPDTGRKSQIAIFDKQWNPIERWTVDGTGCHGLALLEDGTVLTCGSMQGNLISADGFSLHVSPFLTRGLAVGADTIAIGGSQLVEREGRLHNPGTITFLDRSYNVRAVLNVPGAPTELRRLDGEDASLSSYLQSVPWGSTLRPAARGHERAG